MIDHVELMHKLVHVDYPSLGGEDEELVQRIYRLVVNDVVIFARAMKAVPPAAHLEETPYVAGVLFRNKFGRVIMGQMVIVGPEKYERIGMRVGRLIAHALFVDGTPMHDIEFLVYLFLKVAKEAYEVLDDANELGTANGHTSDE